MMNYKRESVLKCIETGSGVVRGNIYRLGSDYLYKGDLLCRVIDKNGRKLIAYKRRFICADFNEYIKLCL